MHERQVTTPFGRRPLTLAQVSAQAKARDRPPEATAHKWTVFRALCAARRKLGVSERALAVLDALLSFHPETALSGDNLVVFPSNAQLSLRAHGMAASTLRRHLAALVDLGLILRRDSPNGKRYARKGQGGEIERAFGFDLSPLVARADEFAALAEEVEAERRAYRLARERLTLARRDLAKAIEAGLAEGVAITPAPGRPATWGEYHSLYRDLVVRIPDALDAASAEALAQAFAALAEEALKILESVAKPEKVSGNESQSGRRLQNSKPESHLEVEPSFEKSGRADYPLGFVLQVCPDIADYSRSGVNDWRDLVAAAEVARAALGVSPDGWREAVSALGTPTAAIVIAAILQRAETIRSPGGYLRELARKAEQGRFSVGPMLMALAARRKHRVDINPPPTTVPETRAYG